MTIKELKEKLNEFPDEMPVRRIDIDGEEITVTLIELSWRDDVPPLCDSDLRVGDWVYLKGNGKHPVRITGVQYESLRKKRFYIDIDEHLYVRSTYASEAFEPIPITRGSLLHNGFHYYGVGLVREGIYVRSMDSNDDEWLVEYTSKDKTISEVKKLSYVHELQNFLRSTDRNIDYQMPRV